jgi:hypothetical protein
MTIDSPSRPPWLDTEPLRALVATPDVRVAHPLDMRPPHLRLSGRMTQRRLDRVRLQLASWAFSTRRVSMDVACVLLPPKGQPVAGDLVLARVDDIGHHGALQLVNGRRRQLFVGNEVVVAYGNRYAPNQFEAEVPASIAPCHLVAAGGIAARARSWHASIARGPTKITPLGLLADDNGKRINLRDFALGAVQPPEYQPTAIAVVGTCMDSGKTQTCVHLVRGLIDGGLRVGYAKITGTGACGDYWSLRDAGADPVLDFTDVGWPTTYLLDQKDVEQTMVSLVHHLARHGVDAMILEIADGVLQRETAALLSSQTFRELVGGIVLAAQDSMGALAGVQWLRERPTPVLALSGMLTAAPLLIGEASRATGLPVYDREALATAPVAMGLLGQAQHQTDEHPPTVIGVARV